MLVPPQSAKAECQRKPNKSDIPYLKNSQALDVPIHTRALLAAILCWSVTL